MTDTGSMVAVPTATCQMCVPVEKKERRVLVCRLGSFLPNKRVIRGGALQGPTWPRHAGCLPLGFPRQKLLRRSLVCGEEHSAAYAPWQGAFRPEVADRFRAICPPEGALAPRPQPPCQRGSLLPGRARGAQKQRWKSGAPGPQGGLYPNTPPGAVVHGR